MILCLGASPRRLGVPGEREIVGKGVSYCAVCDGAFFRDKRLAVVGGGDTAVEDSIFLTRYASEVNIYHRRDEFRAQRIIQERALANPKIRVHWSSVVREIGGDKMVDRIVVEHLPSGEVKTVPMDGVFVLIGTNPNTKID